MEKCANWLHVLSSIFGCRQSVVKLSLGLIFQVCCGLLSSTWMKRPLKSTVHVTIATVLGSGWVAALLVSVLGPWGTGWKLCHPVPTFTRLDPNTICCSLSLYPAVVYVWGQDKTMTFSDAIWINLLYIVLLHSSNCYSHFTQFPQF